jgi:hypothetical protein
MYQNLRGHRSLIQMSMLLHKARMDNDNMEVKIRATAFILKINLKAFNS